MTACYKCGGPLPEYVRGDKPGRAEVCAKCNAYIRCCKNCRFFHPPNDCRETQADWVVNREGANFCEYIQIKSDDVASSGSDVDTEGKPDPFDDLFKK